MPSNEADYRWSVCYHRVLQPERDLAPFRPAPPRRSPQPFLHDLHRPRE